MKCKNLSPTSIKAYSTCAFKYYMERVLKVDLGTNFGALQGSLCHIIYEKFGHAKKDGKPDPTVENNKWVELVLGAYRDDPEKSPIEERRGTQTNIWHLSKHGLIREKNCIGCEYFEQGKCFITDQNIEDFKGCPKDEYEEALWLVEKVINDPTPRSPLNKKIIDIENRFEVNIEAQGQTIPIVGVIDIVNEADKDTVEIGDYKTGNYIQSYNACLKDPQLLMYHLAARHEYSQYKNVIITMYYLKRRPLVFAFSQDDERKTIKSLLYYWNKIRSDRSPQRRCDRRDGSVYFDNVCNNLCNPKICEREYKKFVEMGAIIRDEEEANEGSSSEQQQAG